MSILERGCLMEKLLNEIYEWEYSDLQDLIEDVTDEYLKSGQNKEIKKFLDELLLCRNSKFGREMRNSCINTIHILKEQYEEEKQQLQDLQEKHRKTKVRLFLANENLENWNKIYQNDDLKKQYEELENVTKE